MINGNEFEQGSWWDGANTGTESSQKSGSRCPFCVFSSLLSMFRSSTGTAQLYTALKKMTKIFSQWLLSSVIFSFDKRGLKFLLITLLNFFKLIAIIFSLPGDVVAWRVFRRRTNGGLKEVVHQERKASCVFWTSPSLFTFFIFYIFLFLFYLNEVLHQEKKASCVFWKSPSLFTFFTFYIFLFSFY